MPAWISIAIDTFVPTLIAGGLFGVFYAGFKLIEKVFGIG